jgi:glycosyltransferase involved in cell wall biosynthesis
MNIIYHHRTQATGAEGVHISYIIKGLRELGHRVSVVSPSGHEPGLTAGNNPYARKKTVKTRLLDGLSRILPQFMFELLEIAYNAAASRKIEARFKAQPIDFIYERYAFFLSAGVRLAKKHNIPIIVEVNEIAGHKRVRKQTFVGQARKREQFVFQNATAIIVVSDFLRDEIARLGVDKTKIHVIPNGVDEKEFCPQTVEPVGRQKLGIGEQTVALGFIGWFVGWHNLEQLVDVFGELAPHRDVALVLIGDGVLKEKLLAIGRARGVSDKLILTGAVPYRNIPAYIAALDICVIPGSNEYRSPIKLFEYMAMAKPVVAPRYQPIEAIVTHDVDGLLFDANDRESLKGVLVEAMADPDKRQRIGVAARQTIIERHTWLHNAKKVVALVPK